MLTGHSAFLPMEFLRFIFFLGVIYITFDIIWQLFVWLLGMIFTIDKREGWVYFGFKGLSLYLLVALTAITTQNHLANATTDYKEFAFPAIGLIVLYFYVTATMQKSKLKARIQMDTRTMRRMRFDGFFLFASLALYVLMLYFPRLMETDLADGVFDTIDSIYSMLLFRWIIGFMAFFFLLNVLFRSYLATRTAVLGLFGNRQESQASFTERIMEERRKRNSDAGTVDAEYEIVEKADNTSVDETPNTPAK